MSLGTGATTCAVAPFLTRDPLPGVEGTTSVANPYTYSHNDPLNKTDPLGLRAQDSPDFEPPSPPDPKPSTGVDPPDCARYRSGRIGDYLYDRLKPPCGFQDAVYKPDVVRGFHGNAVLIVGPVTGPNVVDRCSGKPFALIGNAVIGPQPMASLASSEEVERAYQEFDTACRAHDYAYDLVRFAAKQDGWWRDYTNADLVRDRGDADSEMRNISTGVCNDAPWVDWFGVWPKATCWKLRDLMYNGLKLLTWGEGLPK